VKQRGGYWDRSLVGIIIMASIISAFAVPWGAVWEGVRDKGEGRPPGDRFIEVEVTGPSGVEGIYEVPSGTTLGVFLKGLGIEDGCWGPGSSVPHRVLRDLMSLSLERTASHCWEVGVGWMSAGRAFLTGRALDINAADVWDLTLLPGIGQATARKIVRDRATRGPFHSVQDLARVNGIPGRVLSGIKPLVVVSWSGEMVVPD
jgi:hypothetical protein